jgi:Arc/MetJ family transcription regulator
MKTNIDIDDTLIADALQATGLEATDQVIELALKMLVQLKRQEKIRDCRGQLTWEGDLDGMRTEFAKRNVKFGSVDDFMAGLEA